MTLGLAVDFFDTTPKAKNKDKIHKFVFNRINNGCALSDTVM